MSWSCLLVLGLAAVGGLTGLLLGRRLPPLPIWTWADIRRLIALLATIAGAGVLTTIAWWQLNRFDTHATVLIAEMVRGPAARTEIGDALKTVFEAPVWGLKLLLGGVIVVLLSLGFVLGRRQFDLKTPGGAQASFAGGEGEDTPAGAAQAVVGAAAEKAEKIAADAPRG